MRARGLISASAGTILVTASIVACGGASAATTPKSSRARGDELLRLMSRTLQAAPALVVEVAESHDRVRRNGEKQVYTLKREVKLRRPDRLWFHVMGDADRDMVAFYDGRTMTLVGHTQKVYARVDAPPTIDATLDRASERYDIALPMADFLYSNPYDSFADGELEGGWVKRATIERQPCDELRYTGETVDFTVWVAADDRALPCRLDITYKTQPGKPTSRLTFRNWNLTPTLDDGQFTAAVPAGYERIPMMERILRDERKADAAKAMGAPAPAAEAK